MIDLFTHETDSIPFFLKREVATIVDSIPENEFLSYHFLSLDSSKVLYDVNALNHEVVFSGLEGLVRPFMQQYASILFLVFTFLFVFSAFVFRFNGRALFSNFRYLFTLSSQDQKVYSKQITTDDVWTNLFGAFQTFIIYSILFFDLTLQHSSHFFNGHDYIILFSQIFVVISLFVLSKYMVYKFMRVVFSDSRTSSLLDVYLWIIYLTGILSFIPIISYIYIPEVRTYVLIFLLAVFIIGRITVIAKSYTFFVKSHIGILYFFIYLCGVEIMPYFLLYKGIVLIS